MLMLFFCTARYCSILPLPTITLLRALSLSHSLAFTPASKAVCPTLPLSTLPKSFLVFCFWNTMNAHFDASQLQKMLIVGAFWPKRFNVPFYKHGFCLFRLFLKISLDYFSSSVAVFAWRLNSTFPRTLSSLLKTGCKSIYVSFVYFALFTKPITVIIIFYTPTNSVFCIIIIIIGSPLFYHRLQERWQHVPGVYLGFPTIRSLMGLRLCAILYYWFTTISSLFTLN